MTEHLDDLDLNVVFGRLFAEVVRPLVTRIEMLEENQAEITQTLGSLINRVLDNEPSVGAKPANGPCDVQPEPEPGVEWNPCTLPYGHEGPHNVSVVV